MISHTTARFRTAFEGLPERVQRSARRAHRLFIKDPRHPSLQFKQVHSSRLLEGLGRMRVGEKTITVPRYGCVLVAPRMMRQVFNDTPDESLWLIIAAPQEGQSGTKVEPSHFYPQDPRSLPAELTGRVWPPS